MTLLIQVLSSPSLVNFFTEQQWRALVVQGKKANMLGSLYALFLDASIDVPYKVRWHLSGEFLRVSAQKQQALFELFKLNVALEPQVLGGFAALKGVAYILHDTRSSQGRNFSDIDIIVSQCQVKNIEFRLKAFGWFRSEIDDYDDKYYREWMHEIPPLTHSKRFTTLDVHHNILPRTNKQHFDASLFEFVEVEVEHVGKVKTLSKKDMLIHCAVHLFTESEFHNGLRDLYDLHSMMTQFQSESETFLSELADRAIELGLGNYLFYAVRYTQLVFCTEVPTEIVSKLEPYKPKFLNVWDFAFLNVFKPDVKACRTWRTPIAKFLTYWRGHLIRMPLRLLVPHLLRKSWMQLRDKFTKDPIDGEQLP
ncbi:nucleotidyltransferase family protein [Catenovulum agarivorans]|uniref:nucleotidyltransferase family protein n=1 Tax=Catenovulum agarivorans TaxID=1172192 RepID=UPI0012FB0205|nr:nucleotidyltransferase family protein [Catenovulum agarivorans]